MTITNNDNNIIQKKLFERDEGCPFNLHGNNKLKSMKKQDEMKTERKFRLIAMGFR